MKPEGNTPTASVKVGRSFSIIWVVPIVALLIGGWLSFKAWSEKGPEITIVFENAEGLEADKTKIKYKDVEIGSVTHIRLDNDLSSVIVTAEMNKDAEGYLRENTQFWVVRARVAAGEVSGLSTLFSGAYIGCNPRKEGKPTTHFKGLPKPPLVTAGMPGHHFVLKTGSLGSLDVGSPVYYRGIKVGQVVEYGFAEGADSVDVKVFINAPYHEKVQRNSRFWNASGVNLQLNAEGVSVDTQSIVSIMLGGVAFDLPEHMAPGGPAEEDTSFNLYPTRDSIEEKSFTYKRYYLMYFDQNVRGLSAGAPVEMRGIKIGEVVDIKLELDIDKVNAHIAALVAIEPERIDTIIENENTVESDWLDQTLSQQEEIIDRMVEKGLRAQLKTGNLLTGQLYVELDFYPDSDPETLTQRNGQMIIPTLETSLEQIAQRVNTILKKLEKVPFDEIGQDLKTVIRSLDETLKATEEVAGGVNRDILPELKRALVDFQGVLEGINQTLGPDSSINYNARSAASELNATIRSLRALIDYMEQNPQSLLFGKESE